jgi:phosphatidylserine decarboxylase
MKIHREGIGVIIFSSIALITLNILCFAFAGNLLQFIIPAISIILFFWVILFFRSPNRIVPDISNAILSPADGTVVEIKVMVENEYFHKEMLKVSIFMSLLNVHLNRVPIKGKVIYQKYHAGKNLLAFHEKSSVLNEHNTVVIEDHDNKKILVRQIAGFLARRIRPFLINGQEVKEGDELGFIRFGSRVDLFLPIDAKIAVKINQKVKGNISVIAFF